MSRPQYPIYIPSRKRAYNPLTIRMLEAADLPFFVVVESNDYEDYAQVVDANQIIKLPESDYGGVATARNACKAHAIESGYDHHWQLDDDIKSLYQVSRKRNVHTDTAKILASIEEFVERYENIAIAGMGSDTWGRLEKNPFEINVLAYGAFIVNNAVLATWRDFGFEDVDYNLQALTQGWCTIKFNAFLFDCMKTETQSGGYTEIFKAGGRLRMARETQARWVDHMKGAKIVWRSETQPRLRMAHIWRQFKQPLIPKGSLNDN